LLDELREVRRHCAYVSRNQHTSGLRGDPENVRISSAIWNNTSSGTKIDGRLTAA
jgi:hypothetical protein